MTITKETITAQIEVVGTNTFKLWHKFKGEKIWQ